MSFSFPRKLIFRVLTLVLKISRIGCNWLKPREGGLCAVRNTADRGNPVKGYLDAVRNTASRGNPARG